MDRWTTTYEMWCQWCGEKANGGFVPSGAQAARAAICVSCWINVGGDLAYKYCAVCRMAVHDPDLIDIGRIRFGKVLCFSDFKEERVRSIVQAGQFQRR